MYKLVKYNMFSHTQIYSETMPVKKREVVKIRDSKIEIWVESSDFDFIEITIMKIKKYWFNKHIHSYTLVNSNIMDHASQLNRLLGSIRYILATHNIRDDIIDLKNNVKLEDALHHAINLVKYKKKYFIQAS